MEITLKTHNHAKNIAKDNMCGMAFNQEQQPDEREVKLQDRDQIAINNNRTFKDLEMAKDAILYINYYDFKPSIQSLEQKGQHVAKQDRALSNAIRRSTNGSGVYTIYHKPH